MADEAPGITQLNEAFLGLWQPDVLEHSWILPDNFHVKIKVMDQHKEIVHFLNRPYEVITKVNRPVNEGLSIAANVTHSIDGMIVREIGRRCTFDPVELDWLVEALSYAVDSNGRFPDPADLKHPNYVLTEKILAHYHETGFLSARIISTIDENSIQALKTKDRIAVLSLIETLPKNPFPVISVHDRFSVHPNYGNDLRRQYNRLLYEIGKSTMLESIASQICRTPVSVQKRDDFADQILEANYALT